MPILAIAMFFYPFIEAFDKPPPFLRVNQACLGDIELGQPIKVEIPKAQRMEKAESHQLPIDEALYKPERGTWYSVAVTDLKNNEKRTMFVFIDHEKDNIGTLYPGSYLITAEQNFKLGLLAEVDTDESGHSDNREQQDFINRQKFLWVEAWKRVQPGKELLGSVVVPLDRSREGQAQLESMYGRGRGLLSDNEIEYRTEMGEAFLDQTILGQIFDDALIDDQLLSISDYPGYFRLLDRSSLEPECAEPYDPSEPRYIGIELHADPNQTEWDAHSEY